MSAPEIQGYPLSPQQRWLWRLHAAGAPLAVQSALAIAGTLAAEAVRSAATRVAARHEMLRAAFRRPAGIKVPLQSFDGGEPEWRAHDLAGLAAEQRQARLRELLAAELDRPFDLAAGPVLRLSLVRLEPDRHLLAATMPAL